MADADHLTLPLTAETSLSHFYFIMDSPSFICFIYKVRDLTWTSKVPPRSTRQSFTDSMRSSNISGNRKFNFSFIFQEFFFFSFMKQDASWWILLLIIRCRKFREKRKCTQIAQKLLDAYHFPCLKLNFLISLFCHQIQLQYLFIWDTGIAELLWFSVFSLPILQEGQSWVTIFWPWPSILGSIATSKTTNCSSRPWPVGIPALRD